MAKIEVGVQLRWQGRPVICTQIATIEETQFSDCNSVIFRQRQKEPNNVTYMEELYEDFEESDIIQVSLQRIILVEPNKNIYFIYPYYRVRKVTLDGSSTTESSNRQAAGGSPQTDRRGDQGRPGDGQPNPGQDGDSKDGVGQSGGAGTTSHSEVSQAGEHTPANDGNCVASGA